MTENMDYKLLLGDCLEKLKELDDNSVDSIVTDPPYGISFMGSKWDYDVPSVRVWKECLRVLKPGGHILSFSSARTYHRMVVNIEDAGFEIRDQIMWVYGSGFPKSHNIGKAIDKKLGNERKVVNSNQQPSGLHRGKISDYSPKNPDSYIPKKTIGSTEWEGWGTALKPAHEPIVMARKPFKADVANNVLEHGTGALNIDACRVGDEEIIINKLEDWSGFGEHKNPDYNSEKSIGRWPANFIHDGSEEVVSLFPDTGSSTPSEKNKTGGEFPEDNTIKLGLKEIRRTGFADSGSAARYFYCPKASKKDRNEGCEELEEKQYSFDGRNTPIENAYQRNKSVSNNNHPTVKPTELMKYLIRLITPKDGIVLDPFMGSGSTGKAALLEGYSFIGIELSEEYLEIARKRIEYIITIDE